MSLSIRLPPPTPSFLCLYSFTAVLLCHHPLIYFLRMIMGIELLVLSLGHVLQLQLLDAAELGGLAVHAKGTVLDKKGNTWTRVSRHCGVSWLQKQTVKTVEQRLTELAVLLREHSPLSY